MAEVSGQDLDLELRDKLRLLDISLREFGKRGRAYAEAERVMANPRGLACMAMMMNISPFPD